MTDDLPDYYFRIRENGALVFHVSTDNRQRRLELEQIATVNVNNGQIRAQGDRELTEADHAAIADWLARRGEELARRVVDDIRRTVDHLNLTTQWAQSRATDEELELVTDPLLLAMHDLRGTLVRRKAERVTREDRDQRRDRT